MTLRTFLVATLLLVVGGAGADRAHAEVDASILDVRFGSHGDFDRVVFELDDTVVVSPARRVGRRSVELEIAARPPEQREHRRTDLAHVTGLRLSETVAGTRVRFDSETRNIRVFQLHEPPRVIVDFAREDRSTGRALPFELRGEFVTESLASEHEDALPGKRTVLLESDLPLLRAVLSLRDAERLALENNLEIAISRDDTDIAAEDVTAASGAFDPVATAEYNRFHDENPQVSVFQSINLPPACTAGLNCSRVIQSKNETYGAGVSGMLPFGLQYDSSYQMEEIDTNSTFNSLAPEWRPVWSNQLTLPLLRDFINNEANVTVQRSAIGREISEEDFRRTLLDTLTEVDVSYWELAASRANEQVAIKSLETARELLEQTRVQYEVGVVSKVNVSQALAGEAERDFGLITAENRARNAQDVLLDLIAQPTLADYLSAVIATENPGYVDYTIDEAQSVERAMELRPEVIQARHRLEDAELALTLAKNQRMPRLDVVGGYELTGFAGKPKDGVPVVGEVEVPSNIGKSHRQWFSGPPNNSSIGVRFEIPLGNRTRSARASQAEIQLRRIRRLLRLTEQDVTLRVRQAARNMRSAIEGIQAAERRRVAQEDSLRAEQERLRLGDSTPFQVLEFDRDLADAEREEIFALQTYRNSVTGLEAAQGTLLRSRGIDFESELER